MVANKYTATTFWEPLLPNESEYIVSLREGSGMASADSADSLK